jgi:succinate-acetate transporter protein
MLAFMCGLVFSGVTAFPIQRELDALVKMMPNSDLPLLSWLTEVDHAIGETNRNYPFLSYGTDWLAYAHLVITFGFVGALIDPVRNKWLITFGFVACMAVIPFALIAGAVRHIPLSWSLVDISFGVFGMIPLLLCRRLVGEMERKSAGGLREPVQ